MAVLPLVRLDGDVVVGEALPAGAVGVLHPAVHRPLALAARAGGGVAPVLAEAEGVVEAAVGEVDHGPVAHPVGGEAAAFGRRQGRRDVGVGLAARARARAEAPRMVARARPAVAEIEPPLAPVHPDPARDVGGLDVVGALGHQPSAHAEAPAGGLVVGRGLALPADVELDAVRILAAAQPQRAQPAHDLLPERPHRQLVDARAQAAAGAQVVLLAVVQAHDGVGVHHVRVRVEADGGDQVHLPRRVADAEPVAVAPAGAGRGHGVERVDRLVAGPLVEFGENAGPVHGAAPFADAARGDGRAALRRARG